MYYKRVRYDRLYYYRPFSTRRCDCLKTWIKSYHTPVYNPPLAAHSAQHKSPYSCLLQTSPFWLHLPPLFSLLMAPASRASLLLLECSEFGPAWGPLSLPFFLPRKLFFILCGAGSGLAFRFQLLRCLLRTFPQTTQLGVWLLIFLYGNTLLISQLSYVFICLFNLSLPQLEYKFHGDGTVSYSLFFFLHLA